jgi:propanediol dehydratase large subunit
MTPDDMTKTKSALHDVVQKGFQAQRISGVDILHLAQAAVGLNATDLAETLLSMIKNRVTGDEGLNSVLPSQDIAALVAAFNLLSPFCPPHAAVDPFPDPDVWSTRISP